MIRAADELGVIGTEMSFMYFEMTQLSMQQSPWTQIRRVHWSDTAQLDDLFTSESLVTKYGAYIDQRFIDYLSRNYSAIDSMNWRKFEALTCEFFERDGYKVEIGEGRNDGGVDARVWPAAASPDSPPAILVQCKRQKSKIGKVVVKALWADVVDEKARSGLVVTTSALEPGARAVCEARAYPIQVADRATLRKWIDALKTPHSGVFMAT